MDPRAADPDVFLQAYSSIAAGGKGDGGLRVNLGSGKLLYEQSQFLIKLCESMIYWLFWRERNYGMGFGEVRCDRHDSCLSDSLRPVRNRGGRVSMAVTRSSSAFSRSLRSLSDTSRLCIRAKLPRANRSRPCRISVCMSRMDSCN